MGLMDWVKLLAGLALFLYGVREMGESLGKAAGQRMQGLLEKLTRNKLSAVLVGALVTGVIQSSSATTVMVVGFVNAGLLSLGNAIGVIMGANIGTTVTSLMLSHDLDFGIVFAAVGFAALFISRRYSFQMFGRILIGLGVLFIGMQTMTDAMAPMKEWDGFSAIMTGMSHPLVGVLAGVVVTALLQSSSAAVGILLALAVSDLIGLDAAVFILFGQNIGTCVTAMLASIGTNRTARRAAVVHLLFNITGSLLFIFIALTLPFTSWIADLAGDGLRGQIVAVHIIFNVTTTLLLLPLSSLLEKAAHAIIRDPVQAEQPARLIAFDDSLFATPSVAVRQLFRETMRMGTMVRENYEFAMDYFGQNEDVPLEDFAEREAVIDGMSAELSDTLVELLCKTVPPADVHLAGSLFHVIGDLERIADHCVNITEIASSRRGIAKTFTRHELEDIAALRAVISDALTQAMLIVEKQMRDPRAVQNVKELEEKIDIMCDEMTARHLARNKAKKYPPASHMMFIELISNLERIGDHAENLGTSVYKPLSDRGHLPGKR